MGGDHHELIEYIVEHHICPNWHTSDISPTKEQAMARACRHVYTQSDVEKMEEIINDDNI